MGLDLGSLLQRLGPAVQGIAGNYMKQASPFMSFAPHIARSFGQSMGGNKGGDIGSAIGNIIQGMQGKQMPGNASQWMDMAKPFLGALAPHAPAAGQALGSKIGGDQGGNVGSMLGNLFHGQFGTPGAAPAAPMSAPMAPQAPMAAPRPMIGPQMPFGPQMPPAAPNAAPRSFIGPAPPVPAQRPAAMMPAVPPRPNFGSMQDELLGKFASGQPFLKDASARVLPPRPEGPMSHQSLMQSLMKRNFADGGAVPPMPNFGSVQGELPSRYVCENPFFRDASQRQLAPRPQAPMNPHEALMNSLMKRNFADGGYVDGGDYNENTYAHGGPVSLYEAMHHYAMGGHHGYEDMY